MCLRTIYCWTVLLAFVAVAGLTPSALAQNQSGSPSGVVTGTVIDAEANEPIQTATVALWSAVDSSLVTGAITREDGAFTIDNIQPGNYYVRVSFVGYETEIISDVVINSQNQQVDLGQIILATDTAQLDEVEISAERAYMEVMAGKTVYHPQNQPVTAGGSARNVLEEIPSVDVTMDGAISLRGSQNVIIYLNGEPAPMSGDALTGFLEGLSASDVARVEVIPNPSVAYEPEGTSGIINIVLATNTELGWGGGLSASAGTNDDYRGSVNAHYGTGRWNIFSNYSLGYEKDEDSGTRFRANRFMDPTTFLSRESSALENDFDHSFNTTIDYQLSERNTLSFETVFRRSSSDNEELAAYRYLNGDSVMTDRYNRQTLGSRSDFGMDYGLDFERTIEPGEHELSVELGYEQDWEDEGERYIQQGLSLNGGELIDGRPEEERIVDQRESEQEASLEVEYIRPLGEKIGLEAGYEADFEWLESDFYSESLNLGTGNFLPDTTSNRFVYEERLHSVYGLLNGSFGDFGVQVGLRAERAITTFHQQTLEESFDNNYFSLFPSVHVSYKPTRMSAFRISYSKRVRRPGSWHLNPFPNYEDPTFQRVGNPYLKPEYTHSFEAGYSLLGRSYTVSLSPYFRHTVDEISWHERITDEGVTIVTFENFATENSYGLELVGSLTLGEWLRANASFNAFKRVTNATNVQASLSNNALGYTTRLRLTATIVEGLTLQVSQFYRSGHDIPGGSIGAFMRTNVALQQDLFGKKASLSLRASDLLGASGFHITRNTERFYQEFTRSRDPRSVMLSFRYTFGGGGGDGERRGRRDRDWR